MLPGKALRIGLQLINPFFTNFTAVDSDFASSQLLYRNTAVPTALDAPISVTLTGQIFSHALSDNARPVTVTLQDAAGLALQTDEITADNDRSTVSYDLTGQLPGAYTIEETYPAQTRKTYCRCRVSQTSARTVATPTTFTHCSISKPLRGQEATQLSLSEAPADFNQLAGTCHRYGRAQINFSKVSSASFTAADISPALLGDSFSQVVLFKSQAAVARMDKGRRGVQLKKNSQVLIEDLPQPSAAKPTADLIIPVSKPN
jgi:hypothetical protein